MPSPPSATPDPQAVVAEIEAEVARKRAEGRYPEALLSRLDTEFRPDEEIEAPETRALIESARPLRSNRAVVGPVILFGKRVVRRLLAWYIAPIAADQTQFNLAILRELRALEGRVRELEGHAVAAPEDSRSEPPAS